MAYENQGAQIPVRGQGRRKFGRTFKPRFLQPGDELKLPNEIGGEEREEIAGAVPHEVVDPPEEIPEEEAGELYEHFPTQEPKPVSEEPTLETDGDLTDIWERRLLNPFGTSAPRIRITRPGMHLRWINLSARGRYQRARYDQGYMPVTKDLLVDEREVWGVTYTSEGYVCRGEKQAEMLMMIPEVIYKQLQMRKSRIVEKSYENLKDTMRQAGSTHFGDKYGGSAGEQAADIAGGFKGTIKFGRETVES